MSAPATPQYEPDRLDDALDAFFAGRQESLDELDSGAADVMGQLRAWAELGGLEQLAGWLDPQPSLASLTSNALISKGHPMSTPLSAAMPVAGMRSPMPHRGRIPLPSPLSVVSWVVIVAIVASAIWGAGNRLIDRDPAPTMSAYQPSTSPEPTAQYAEVNYGGDASHSWYLGDTTPVIGDQPVAFRIDDQRRDVISPPLVVGDTMIVTTMDATSSDANYQTIRYNLATREVMWTANEPLMGPLASDGEYVYGTISRESSDELASGPAALDLETGEITFWTEWPVPTTANSTPIAFDGHVYWSYDYGSVAVMSRGQLEAFWPASQHDVPGPTGTYAEASLAFPAQSDFLVTEEAIFVERPSKTIVKIDRHSGREVGSFNVDDDLRLPVHDVTLQAADNGLVVAATIEPFAGDSVANPTTVLVYDIEKLSMIRRIDVPDVDSNLVVSPEGIYLAQRISAQRPVTIFRVDSGSGTLVGPVSDFSSEGTALRLSLSGSTLMVVGPPSTYAFIDVKQGSVIQSGEVPLRDDEWLMAFPIQLWGNVPIAVSDVGTVIVFGEPPAS